MRKKIIWIEFAIIIFVAAGLYFFISKINNVKIETPSLISAETERKIGDLVLKEIVRKYPKIQNKKLDESIKKIHQRLTKNKKLRLDYTYTIVKSDIINAVTLPGGHIVIFSELIEVLDNPEQLAAVIGHEFGHSEMNHIVSRMLKTFGLQVIFSVLSGGEGVILSEIMHMLISNEFDRDQEKQADEFGLKLLHEQKLNPHHLASVFRKFKEKIGDVPTMGQIFSSHPSNEERIRAALEYPLEANFKEERLNVSWPTIRNAVK